MKQLGRYEILDELGQGAMGKVYRARDPKIDRLVALKTVLLANLSPDDHQEFRERFFREAQAAGRLSHPGIVTIHDVGEDDATHTPFIVMEYIEGKTLEALAQEKPLASETVLELVGQVAEALDYAHSRQIVHRDIKPANIIVTPEGRATITDFGIAKLALTQYTMTGQVLGTPAYMSPEQIEGGTVDGRSDLFSLGAVLYRLLTGDKPFSGDSVTSLSFKVVYKDPRPATQLNPSLSPEVDAVLQRALAKDPAERYQTGKEFAEDLVALRQGRPLPSLAERAVGAEEDRTQVQKPERPAAPTAPGGRPSRLRRLPRKAYFAVAGGALIVLALLGALTFYRGPTAPLHIKCEHAFERATLSIWADQELIYQGELIGKVSKRLLVFKKVEGSFFQTVSVPAGHRLIRVRVHSPQDGYDQIRTTPAEFIPDTPKTLQLRFGRGNRLSLVWAQ